jgi:hypothetical protein
MSPKKSAQSQIEQITPQELEPKEMKMELTREEVVKAAAQYEKHKAWMAAYNKRPERQLARKAYNSARWQRLKSAYKIAKSNGLA